jgi:hypothetical protein
VKRSAIEGYLQAFSFAETDGAAKPANHAAKCRGTDTQHANARQGTRRRNPLKNTAYSPVFAAAANAAFQDN